LGRRVQKPERAGSRQRGLLETIEGPNYVPTRTGRFDRKKGRQQWRPRLILSEEEKKIAFGRKAAEVRGRLSKPSPRAPEREKGRAEKQTVESADEGLGE